jgi:RNA recognition motif-containing protein
MNIYIGNLTESVTDQDLTDAFSKYGKLKSVKVIKDLFSGRCKGFGFVEMYSNKEGQKAIDELNTTELKGKKMIVNEARPQNNKKKGKRRR